MIFGREETLKVIKLINGYMRTNKISKLHRVIEWLNDTEETSIPLLGKDTLPINRDSWFTGFLNREKGLLFYLRK